MMKLSRDHRSQAGDTIVEVLIAIAVISFALSAAYLTSNHNTATFQDSQEHTQALKLVQGQAELLRAYLSTPGTSFTGNQCLTSSGGSLVETSSCTDPSAAQYKLNISAPDLNGVYKITADWDSVSGTPDEVSIYYAAPN